MPHPRLALRACAILLPLALGCGDDGSGSPADDVDGSTPGGGACGEPATIALGSWVERTVSVAGGGSRPYFVRLPSDYDPDTEYPVVYQLHGCSSGANRETNNVPVENASGGAAIHVRGRAADDCWDNTTDLPYFDAIVSDVDGEFCTDTSRRLLAGYSSGAFFAHRIACVRGDRFRGIATIAGGSPGNACIGTLGVLQIHDTDDTTVTIGSSGIPTRDFWVGANHCEATTTPGPTSPCVEYDGCDANGPVVWCQTSGMNHARQDGFAAPLFWNFLSGL